MTGTFSMLVQLFLTFAKIGLFTIGGGYAMIPMIRSEVVTINGWLTAVEMTDIVAISQMTPGPVAINAATFTGMKMASVAGACAATLGVVFPSLIIASIVARVLFAFQRSGIVKGVLYGMRPAVTGLIAAATITITLDSWYLGAAASLLQSVDFVAVALSFLAMYVIIKRKVNPILVILASGIVGILLHLIGI